MAIPGEDVATILISMVLSLATAVTIILRGPVGRALARRIEGTTGLDADAQVRLDQLDRRLTDLEVGQVRAPELEALQGCVGELEERLDFAERMLAQQRAPGLTAGEKNR
jgi:CO dehydrogenase/acetyl-CoA synthase alpha subunit